jgi:hypothetical protein
MTKIYSAFFAGNLHCTWEFNPGKCTLPCEENAEVTLVVIGEYADDDIACDIVEAHLPNGDVLTTQQSGTLLHMTTRVSNGVSPVQSGIRATKNGYNKVEPREVTAKAGYFRA